MMCTIVSGRKGATHTPGSSISGVLAKAMAKVGVSAFLSTSPSLIGVAANFRARLWRREKMKTRADIAQQRIHTAATPPAIAATGDLWSEFAIAPAEVSHKPFTAPTPSGHETCARRDTLREAVADAVGDSDCVCDAEPEADVERET